MDQDRAGVARPGGVIVTEAAAAEGPILDELVVTRLRELRLQVQKPGEDLLGELIGLFERDSALRLSALRSASTSDERRQAAHALKGSAANLGAARVAALALHIEKNPAEPADLGRLARSVSEAIAELRLVFG